ncbi:hypothetical protein B0H21DRAFT_749654 [Amylocystis lapponica]|nr:hypothetical protein B0H21DRAFT_749654 [Amylocystis lapponica]
MNTTPPSSPGAGSHLVRYVVRSSDVLSDMRINVSEEGSEKVMWYKERFLADEEIVEHLVENATSTILWTMHRPKRGWYIRIRTPSFPPGVFISLLPLPRASPYHADAALTFACRTNPPSAPKRSEDSDVTLTDVQRGSAVHSYPPTPPTQVPTFVIDPPSPRSVHAKLAQISPSPSSSRRPSSRAQQPCVSHFVLVPESAKPPESVSMFSRVVSVLRSSAPTHSYSFMLAPTPGPPSSNAGALPPMPLLWFRDTTPVWTARSSSGVIELDTEQERALGVGTSFYVAVALTDVSVI